MTIFNKKISLAIAYISVIIIFPTMLFGRSFIGLQYGGIRLGELIIFGGFFISIIFFIYSFVNPKFFYKEILLSRVHQLFIFLFILSVFINRTLVTSPYTYKVSSYIWTVGFIFLGKLVAENEIINKKIIILLITALPLNYLFSTGRYPNIIMGFFREYSDKFQFLKGSDILLTYLIAIILSYILFDSQKIKFLFLFFSSGLMIPLLLFLSRGAFLPAFIFFVFEIVYFRKFILNNLTYSLLITLLTIPIFLGSTLNVYGNLTFTKVAESIQVEEENIVVDSLTSLITDKNTHTVFLSFYIQDGRLTSQDITTRWRLDIWQDVIEDMVQDDIVIKGYGYNEIIPAMIDPNKPGRTGRDGKNENLHNYFLNVFARGGIGQLFLYLSFFYLIIRHLDRNVQNYRITSFIFGALITSSFDPAMEGVQFPLIFYFFLGYLISMNLNHSSNEFKYQS